ncbi:copper resistance protein B [Halomonas nitroreducens]|uniref:Copper resistance protein B n=1 Tax=Halomonas nitroreducens TaxID=447425 RepID=A0A3S0HMY1_9GAMM|nr:copper resistance protein B [Halomonas nitroreducens]RTQ99621.1 copper resistance protein B [Halomonas nitroreducens]
MKSRIITVGIGTSLVMLAATGSHAEDGYDAPHDWPSPITEHSRGSLLVDRLEYASADKGEDALAWDFRAWYGGDLNRLYLKGEGENVQGDNEAAEFENLDLLYSRLIAPFWELQGGIGYQGGIATDDHPGRYFGVINLQGLAPHRFETDIDLRVSDDGDISAGLEGEYDLRLTQRTYLQPRVEIAVAGDDVPAFGVGEGLNSIRTGLRLRYEVTRKFAPYLGVYWEKAYGETADLARIEGKDVEDTGIVAGLRFWY